MTLRFNTIMRALLAGNSTPSVPSFYFNFSNPSNVTLGAAQARGTITSTQNAVISASVSPSRTTGVAPLYVNFDATGTTSTLSANPSHELFFAHDFGDTGAGTWANGVQSSGLTSKNAGYGPVTGHVYETPGTFPYTLVITDGVNTVTKTGTVVVLDPNVVYDPAYGAGYETICISNSNNFTGAPGTGALPGVATYINRSGDTDMYAAWIAHKASNKRILFCKSDSWTISATISANGLTNMIVGGYGTGVNHTFSSGTMVSATAALSANPVFSSSGASDTRFCNFRIDAIATVAFGASSADDSQVTWYKMEVRNASSAFSLSANLGANTLFKHDQDCIYECLHDDAYGYAGIDLPSFTGVTASNGSPCVFTATGHNFKRVNKVRLVGTPPTGFATLTDYYISATNLTANTFSLTASPSIDTPLASSSTGTCDVNAVSLGGGVGAFVTTTRGGIMGSYFDNCNHGEQTMRCQYIHSSHINNNTLKRPNQTKNILKINSRRYDYIITVPGVSGWTEKIVITGNFLDLRNGYSYNDPIPNNGKTATVVGDPAMVIMTGGSGEGVTECLRNFIVQNNHTQTSLGSPANSSTFINIGIENITVRNNIFDASIGTDRAAYFDGNNVNTYLNFASVSSRTKYTTAGVRIYNNTLFSNMRNAERAELVSVQSPIKNTATGLASTGVFTANISGVPTNHNMIVGDRVRLVGTPPSPFLTGTDYYVTATSLTLTTFTLNAAVGGGGAPMAITVDGTCYSYKSLDVDDLRIQNNLWYLPYHAAGNTAIGAIYLGGTPVAVPTNVTNTNNTDSVTGGGARNTPNFAATPPVLLTDWRPTTGYAVDQGATVPVLKDFNMASRVGGTYDLGAVLP